LEKGVGLEGFDLEEDSIRILAGQEELTRDVCTQAKLILKNKGGFNSTRMFDSKLIFCEFGKRIT